MTELQHAFVTRCLANNMIKTVITGQDPVYTKRLVDVCSEIIRDNFQDYALFECEEDSYEKNIDIDYLEDHQVEAMYIGYAMTKEEFLVKYTNCFVPENPPQPTENTMTERTMMEITTPKTIAELKEIDDRMGFGNLQDSDLIDLQGIMIANIDSETWEHTDELQELFDKIQDIINLKFNSVEGA